MHLLEREFSACTTYAHMHIILRSESYRSSPDVRVISVFSLLTASISVHTDTYSSTDTASTFSARGVDPKGGGRA